MADVQRKDAAVGSHGVVPLLHLHGAAPRMGVEEHPPANRAPLGPPPPESSPLATLIRNSAPLKWSFRENFRLESSFVSFLAKTKLR